MSTSKGEGQYFASDDHSDQEEEEEAVKEDDLHLGIPNVALEEDHSSVAASDKSLYRDKLHLGITDTALEEDHSADDDEENVYQDNSHLDISKLSLGEDDSHERFRVLTQENICQIMKNEADKVSHVLCVSSFKASILLLCYNWISEKLFDAWLSDEKKARQKAGLIEKPLDVKLPDHGDIRCGLCNESHSLDEITHSFCGHFYCNACWSSYIKNAIYNNGHGSLFVKCPEPFCSAAVGEDIINKFTSEEDKKKYLIKSYIEANKKRIKWCPGKGCKYAIELVNGSENSKVLCSCCHEFCWKCLEPWNNHKSCKVQENEEMKEKGEKHMRNKHKYDDCVEINEISSMESQQIVILDRLLHQHTLDLNFLTEAWQQISKCRRVLNWIYAHLPYLSDEDSAKGTLFEFLEGDPESYLERLQGCAEEEVKPFLKDGRSDEEFNEFRTKLMKLTAAAKTHFESIVKDLKKELPEVNTLCLDDDEADCFF